MRRSYATLVAVCTFWGTIPFLSRQVELPAAAIVFVRVWVAAAGLGLVVALGARRTHGPRLFSHRPLRSIAVGVLLAVHWTAMFAGYQRASDDTVVFMWRPDTKTDWAPLGAPVKTNFRGFFSGSVPIPGPGGQYRAGFLDAETGAVKVSSLFTAP